MGKLVPTSSKYLSLLNHQRGQDVGERRWRRWRRGGGEEEREALLSFWCGTRIGFDGGVG